MPPSLYKQKLINKVYTFDSKYVIEKHIKDASPFIYSS